MKNEAPNRRPIATFCPTGNLLCPNGSLLCFFKRQDFIETIRRKATFTSAFEVLLNQGEPAFFYCLSPHLSFIAMSPPFASCVDFLVVISKSSKGLRDALQTKGT
jgi:hypothetical protein